MPWYAIRTVYLVGQKADGANVFEERVVSFEAADWDAAHAKGDAESTAYADGNGYEAHREQSGYEQDGAALVDGYEVWSELFESKLGLDAFYDERYERFAYEPDAEQ